MLRLTNCFYCFRNQMARSFCFFEANEKAANKKSIATIFFISYKELIKHSLTQRGAMNPEKPSQEDKNKMNGSVPPPSIGSAPRSTPIGNEPRPTQIGSVPPQSGNVPPPSGNVPPPKPRDSFYNYFSSSTRDLIAYILLVIGIVLLFFQQYYGGFLIGLVTGAYFSEEINTLFKNYQAFVDKQGLVRSLILGGLTIAFIISAPAIFIGIAFVVILKYFIFAESK